jgi:hypothetical protein
MGQTYMKNGSQTSKYCLKQQLLNKKIMASASCHVPFSTNPISLQVFQSVSNDARSSLNSDFIISKLDVCIRTVPSCTPHSFSIFIASAMVGTWLVIGFDEASILVLILSTPSSILQQVCLNIRWNGLLLSSLSSTLAKEDAFRFLLF